MSALVLALFFGAPLPDLDAVSFEPIDAAEAAHLGRDGLGYVYDAYSETSPGGVVRSGFTCYDEAAPDERATIIVRTVGDGSAPVLGSVYVASAGDGAFVPPNGWLSCRDALAGDTDVVPLELAPSEVVLGTPDGTLVCALYPAAHQVTVDCVRRGASGDTVEQWADSVGFDAALGVDPWDPNDIVGEPPGWNCPGPACEVAVEGWRIRDATFAPSGDAQHLFVLAERLTIFADAKHVAYDAAELGWVIELTPGHVTSRLAPPKPLRRAAADGARGVADAETLIYEPALDALLIGAERREWSNDLVAVGFEGGVPLVGPRGFGGVGYDVLPIDEQGLGYLSLTQAGYRLDPAATALPSLVRGPDGARARRGDTVYRMSLDRPAIDLDGDGLTGAEEAALGTSDWQASSDAGLDTDGLEVLLGTDPHDGADDPGSRVHDATTLTAGLLWRFHNPFADPTLSYARSFATNGAAPLCAGGVCYDPSGAEVGRYSPGAPNPTVSLDGRHVAHGSGGANVVELASGEGRYLGHEGADYDTVVALDGEHAFAAVERDGHARVDYLDGADVETLFELETHAPPLDADGNLDEVRGNLRVVAYDAGSAALLITFESTWRTFIYALRPGEPPYALARVTGGEMLFADHFAAYADGLVYGHVERSDDDLGLRSAGVMQTPEGDFLATTRFALPYFHDATSAWGTVFGHNAAQPVVEVVRLGSLVEAGEIYTWGTHGAPSAIGELMRGSPRGGLVPLGDGARDDEPGAPTVSGLGLSSLHHLCVADPVHDLLRELVPSIAGGPPDREVLRVTLPDVHDCVYDQDERLWVLTSAGVFRRDAPGDDFAEQPEVVLGPTPLHFDQRAPFVGIPTVLDQSEACGRLTTRTGHVLVADCAGALRLDGSELAIAWGMADEPVRVAGEVVMLERGDGRIVVSNTDHGLVVIDLARALALPYALASAVPMTGIGLAQIPLAAELDPWSTREVVGPRDPSAGTILHADEGCGSAPDGSFLGLLLLMRAAFTKVVYRRYR